MSSYKNKFRKSLEKKDQQQKAITAKYLEENAFESTVSEKNLIKAYSQIGTLKDRKQITKAKNILLDKEADVNLRVVVLKVLTLAIGKNEKLMQAVLAILVDNDEPVTLKMRIINTMQGLAFSSQIFPSFRADYLDALRGLVEDKSKKLRKKAMEILAIHKDEYVQRKLIEGLENPELALINADEAIQLLAYDLHADHYPLLRKIADTTSHLPTRKEAVRNLATDSKSKDYLLKILKSKKEDSELRHICAVALQKQAPDEVESAAKSIITSKVEDGQLKTAMLNTLIHLYDDGTIKSDKKFARKLDKISEVESRTKLSRMYKRLKRKM